MKNAKVAILCLLLSIVYSVYAENYDFTALSDTFHLNPSIYSYADKIEIGQGRVGPVNGELWDVTVPLNRVTWAIAIAHGYQLMRNIIRAEIYPSALFFATALKESSLGCDADIEQDQSLQYPIKQIWDTGDGFYQIEGWEGSAYGEMSKIYPKRFPSDKHAELIGDNHFETATLSKVYYDLMVLLYWKYQKQYRPLELFDNSTDSHGILKMVSAAYYMGHQGVDSFYNFVFNTNRVNSYLNDYLTFFDEEPYGSDSFYQNAKTHAEKVSQVVSVFQDSASKEGIPSTNFFTSYYDTTVTLSDIYLYINKITPLYPQADTSTLKIGVQTVFNSINNGNPIKFKDNIGKIVDYLILQLPIDNPVPGIQSFYPFIWDNTLDYIPNFNQGSTANNSYYTNSKNIKIKSSSNFLFLSSSVNHNLVLNIYDLRGRDIIKTNIAINAGDILKLNLSKMLNKGSYVVKIEGTNNIRIRDKLLIK